MKRHRLLLATAFLVCSAISFFTGEGRTTEAFIPTAGLPTRLLGSVAAIGDSITAAFNAAYSEFESCQYRDTPNYSFATNKSNNTTISIAERAIVLKGSGVATANFGSDGARMTHGDDQALEAKAWLMNQATPRLITVFLGHNDICSGERDKQPGSCSSGNRDPNNYCRTSTFAYEQQMRQMMDVLVTIPDSQIAIIHPIRVSQLCNFRDEKVIDEPWITVRCKDLWDTTELFGQDGVCPSLTDCTVDRVTDAYATWVAYRDISNRVVDEYNLYTAGETIPVNPTYGTGNTIRADNVFVQTTDVVGNSKFRYRDGYGNAQLSVCECFHPSKYGQNLIAGSLWDGVACSTMTPCCDDSAEGDSDYDRGLCNSYTTVGWMDGPWAGLDEDKTLTAAKTGSGTGVITSTPAGIDCGTDCTETYSHGTVVTLTASADPDSVFRGWNGGGCPQIGPCVLTLIETITVTATFVVRAELSPTEGTVGTRITISGSDFGTRKGRVLINDIAAKIANDGWNPDRIICTVNKPPLPADVPHPVSVMVNKATTRLDGTFTLRNPRLDQLLDTSGIPGREIMVTGMFFGTKKGRVFLEDLVSGKRKNCKVTSWQMNPASGESRLTFIVPKLPKELSPGVPYPLKVRNVVGTVQTTFTVDPSPP